MTKVPDNTTEAILRNARAAENERLRNVARTTWPQLNEQDLEDKVRELQTEKLREAGRLGRAKQQQNADAGREWITLRPELEQALEQLLRRIRNTHNSDAA